MAEATDTPRLWSARPPAACTFRRRV